MGMRDAGGLLKRRGLLAGAAALVGAGLAKLGGPERAEATSGTPATQGAMILGASLDTGQPNLATSTTDTRVTVGSPDRPGFRVQMVIGGATISSSRVSVADAIQGHTLGSNAAGVYGFSDSAPGVLGEGGGAGVRGAGVFSASSGVVGVAAGCDFGNASAVGVGGSGRNTDGLTGTKTGVLGVTGQGIGVEGWGMKAGTGVRGSSNFGGGPDFSGSGIGVEGRSGTGVGVQGVSTSSIGVYGISTNYFGAGGITQKASYAGLFGYGGVAGSYGFYGAAAPGGAAALFVGNVTIQGSLTVSGSYPKSAAVKKRDGTQARMYCMESPESWFEDFGRATLTNGRAVVQLDPEFDEVVKGDDYHVFLTPIEVDCSLYVSRLGPHRFEVRSVGGAAVSGSFAYRVVARRFDDVGKRMEKVEVITPPLDIERLTKPLAAPPQPPKETGR
jgi:hypothetical protein